MACAIMKIPKTLGINRFRNITAIFKERSIPTHENSLVFYRFLSFNTSKETHFPDGCKPKINVLLNRLSTSAAANYAFQANAISRNTGHATNSAAEEDLRILAKEGKLKEAMEAFTKMEEKGCTTSV
ncbi:hypothetical protein SUGI_1118840 [Cryptomeria japonica]|nr:hypothetical protein SUGI_1118840 [Cryptomeria japonica]